MPSCNTAQNERSGKDLLLKICKEVEIDVAVGTADDPTAILLTAHGFSVGDLVRFSAVELGTIDDVTADQLYFIKSVTANAFKIASTPTGTAIDFDQAITDMTIEVFETVGGLRSSGSAFASEGIDISSHGSNQWRKMKDGAGMRQVSISGSGVYSNIANYRAMEVSAFANLLVCLAFVDVAGGRIKSGCFKITALEETGEYDGEATFSMSAESSGEVTVYQSA
jgi:predicted secreted protein